MSDIIKMIESLRLLRLTFSVNKRWKDYIQSFARLVAYKFGSLRCASQVLLSSVYVTYLYVYHTSMH